MAQQIKSPPSGDSGSIITGYRWLATLFAALVVIQAFLGTRGYFGQPNLTDVHGVLANTMFLLAVGQAVLAWLLYTRNIVAMRDLGLNGALVLLTIAQIGLGYSTRDADAFLTTVSLHVPNGVLMMGVSTVLAALAWQIGRRGASA